MNDFVVERIGKKPKMKNPVLIEGLPGIGNVARIAADFLINKLKAKKMMKLYSKYFPNSVFINEEKLIEPPKIELYHAKHKGKDYIIVVGDVQPAEETASYIFSNGLVEIAEEFGVKEIITLGGITAKTSVNNPPVYGACTDRKYIPILKKVGVHFDRKGAVIIVGAAGLMLGLGKIRNINGFILLAETATQSSVGISAAKSILIILMKYLKMNFPVKDLNANIQYVGSNGREKQLKRRLMQRLQMQEPSELHYIG